MTLTDEELLSEDFLRKLERLQLLSGRVTPGPHQGAHRSWRSGTSLEFLDYRRYQAGDDIRYVDWNIYGRSDKLFLKLFRSEEDLPVYFLIDGSRSMAFGKPPKFLVALKTAAALGYLALSNQERVGLVTFADSLKRSSNLKKGKKAYTEWVRSLRATEPEGKTGINASLQEFAGTCPRPGLAVVLSDLLDQGGWETGLEALQHRKYRILLLQLLDRQELLPSWEGYLFLKEMETGERKKITLTGELRSLYREKVEGFLAGIRERCLAKGIEYHLLRTDLPFEDLFFGEVLGGKFFL